MNTQKDKSIGKRLLDAPPWLYFCLLLLLVALSYSNSIYSPFVLDDFHSFVLNQSVYSKDVSWASLEQLGSTRFGKTRIIPLATFAIDHHLAAGSMVQYHLTNILIHLLCTLSVFLLVKSLLRSPVGNRSLKYFSAFSFSLLVAAFWSLNPVQTNAVTYIVQRMTSISTFFYVISLVFYSYGRLSKSGRAKVIFLSGALFAALCSFLSKENSFTLPFAILMVEFYFLSRKKIIHTIKSLTKTQWIILFIILLLLLPFAEYAWHKHVGSYGARVFSLHERVFTELRVVVFYISLLLLPLPGRLNLEHDFLISGSLFSPPETFLSLILLFFLFVYALRTIKTFPLISFGILWFFLNLAIESTVIPLEIIFEHRLYLSSIGFFITIISITDLTAFRISSYFPSSEFKTFIYCLLLFLICLSSILTTFRNNDWRDAITIHSDFAAKSPNKVRVYNDLGTSLSREGRNDEALAVLQKGLELDKEHGLESMNLVNNTMVALSEMGKIEEGIEVGEKFIKDTPLLIDVTYIGNFLYNLGVLYSQTGNYDYALDSFIGSINSDPKADYAVEGIEKLLWKYYDDPEARQILGMTGKEGDKVVAMRLRLAEIMCDIKQYNRALHYLGVKRNDILDTPEAKELLSRIRDEMKKNSARQKESKIKNHLPYRQNISYKMSLYLAGFIEKYYSPLHLFAGWLIKKADQLEPDDPFVALSLSQWLIKEKNTAAALDILSKSVELHPDFVPLLDKYAVVLQRAKRTEEAGDVLGHILNIYPGHPKWKEHKRLIRLYKGTQ